MPRSDLRASARFPRWTNWAHNFACRPEWLHRPETLDAIVQVIREARASGRTVRPVGSGYSYTRLVQTDAILLSLERYTGIEALDPSTRTVRVRAGTKLRVLVQALAREGFALECLGDIDQQTVAGAIATGTHGTGAEIGNLSTLLEELVIVTGEADVVTLRRGSPQFAAAQVSLGALGVVASARLRVVPLYDLEIERRSETLASVLENLETDVGANRNYEFFWFPCSDVVYSKRMNVATPGAGHRRPSRWRRFLSDVILENAALWATCCANRRWPRRRAWLVDLTRRCIPQGTCVLPASQAYATPRLVRHQEMEYALPRERTRDILLELGRAARDHGVRTLFPVEVRFTRADDALLSPSFGRDVVYVAVHTHTKEDHREYFDFVEALFRRHGGRPHWGKLHGLSAGDLEQLYPGWRRFEAVRGAMDPGGLFLNHYLRRVLSPAPDRAAAK